MFLILPPPNYPGLTFGSIVLPILNDFDYDLLIIGNVITYRYFHNLSGTTVNVEIDIPTRDYSVRNIMVLPTTESIGMAILIHAAVPGYERSVILPLLSAEAYTVSVNPSANPELGEVMYTYFDTPTNSELSVNYAYNYADLTWDYGISPTLTTSGAIVGTSSLLPGAIFTIEIPKLSNEAYDIEEDDEFTTYTLKDKTYGTFFFKIPIIVEEVPPSLNVWPYFIGVATLILLVADTAIVTLSLRKNHKEKSESS